MRGGRVAPSHGSSAAEADQMFGGKTDDQLPERGRLGVDAEQLVEHGVVVLETGFRVDEVDLVADGVFLVANDGRKLGPFDRVVTANRIPARPRATE